MKHYQIAVIAYPHCLLSAVYGFAETFELANEACAETGLDVRITTHILREADLLKDQDPQPLYHAVLLPPSLEKASYSEKTSSINDFLIQQHQQGAMLCSACAGAFFLAYTGLTDKRVMTTHWALEGLFKERFPNQPMDTSKILINQGDVISAGGMMSWMDLALELVQSLTNAHIVRQLGKILVIDTGKREQRYYQQFQPNLDHGDAAILAVQHYLQGHFAELQRNESMAARAKLTPRTFLRRFAKCTGLNPNEYIQRLRIQMACNALEQTTLPFESIALQIGYEDVGSCRKAFQKIMGLTPSAFRQRFVSVNPQ
ncbi:helix-turn-helix domain-containing protein [Marinomonas sp. M1K-6]|uniref:Helix-turn-helix domain-containing protein n=1 Tax=Marinomonas profundi TaxID=2726122 RepID=A0A847QWF8_9GAMM|nr:helix-turn-helix domain-containing protein [Marinomonas profundi]NLQ17668.1 helix-turn-helix domain-containing protein [Marinomonas profundi]UDV02116.1 helix-turn-helix domain-containing protein [Marinomonas profundi]